ncbi:MAG TPA: PQQ-binding-like beta-propeller repeat protein [Abditibacteriaceae bacterium]|jgi:outer membrane protein assembly factor BamB
MKDSRERQRPKKPAVPNVSQVAARNQQARRSKPLLDPHGIYGTRTAYRVRAAQRRQTIQYLCAFGVLLFGAGAFLSWLRAPRIANASAQWSRSLNTLPSAAPVAASSGDATWILVPTESGKLITLNAASGEPGAVFTTTFPLRGEPVVSGGQAFVPGEDGALFAIDWPSGKALWSYRTASSMSARPALLRIPLPTAQSNQTVATTPVADVSSPGTQQLRRVVVVGNDGGEIIALDAGQGKPLWRRKVDAAVGGALVAVTSTRVAGADTPPLVLVPLMGGLGTRGGLLCLDARNGHVLWRADLRAAHLAAPAVGKPSANGAESRVFAVGDDGAVFSLDLRTGRRERGGWKTFMRPLPGLAADGAVVLRAEPLLKTYSWGTRLFVGGNDGGVRCLDARSGQVLWTFDAGAPVRCRLRSLRLQDGTANARDLLVIGNDSSALLAVDARTGDLAGRFPTGGKASFSPVVAGNQLLNVADNGQVEAFRLPGR